MVGFNLRFAPFYRKMHEMIDSGALGRVLTIQADEFYYGGRTYFRRWNRLRRYGGGLWITKASHDFDLLYWMAGKLPVQLRATAALTHYTSKPEGGTRCSQCPIEASCPDSNAAALDDQPPHMRRIIEIRQKAGWPPTDFCLYNSDKDTFDHGIAQVEFEDDLFAVYTLNVVAAYTDRHLRISGTAATAEGSLESPRILAWNRHEEAREPQEISPVPTANDGLGSHGGGDKRLLDDFAAFVRGEPSAVLAPAEASVAVAMGLAATASSDSAQTQAMSGLPGWPEILEYLD